jgi:diaminohydroxyphosphoribosylaminopyrimidine deaminase / 5-amino-6-(5-phosphoribosylamino)uracil reductase
MSAMTDRQLMQRALRLARRGLGRVEPNPMVGCVLARQGSVIAEGFHQVFGGPHAEIMALRACRASGGKSGGGGESGGPAGCDVFVTLEPCCHFGKTPPCTDALIQARPARVIAAMTDPFPQVAGQGLARLREAGIAVEAGLCEEDARRLNEPYLKRIATGLPWVIAKWAQTLDGRIADAGGGSRWISGERSRRLVHIIRGRVDAVMAGIGTVLADDPRLTARRVPVRRRARRVVIDPTLRLPIESQLVKTIGDGPGQGPLLVAVREDVLTARPEKMKELEICGVEFIGLPQFSGQPGETGTEAGTLSLRPLLEHLSQRHGATNVLAEGGAHLFGALLAQKLVDQVLAFVCPRLLGDDKALSAVVGHSSARIAQAINLSLVGVRRIEQDVLLDYRLR